MNHTLNNVAICRGVSSVSQLIHILFIVHGDLGIYFCMINIYF